MLVQEDGDEDGKEDWEDEDDEEDWEDEVEEKNTQARGSRNTRQWRWKGHKRKEKTH